MADQRNNIQLVWGVALLLAGLGVFYRIPQVMPRLEEETAYFSSGTFAVRVCFYIVGGILVAGGAKKIYRHFREKRK